MQQQDILVLKNQINAGIIRKVWTNYSSRRDNREETHGKSVRQVSVSYSKLYGFLCMNTTQHRQLCFTTLHAKICQNHFPFCCILCSIAQKLSSPRRVQDTHVLKKQPLSLDVSWGCILRNRATQALSGTAGRQQVTQLLFPNDAVQYLPGIAR